MNMTTGAVRLDDLGILRFTGPDSVKFLQGQLSQDVARVSPTQPLLAGYHTPQGRAIALLRLIASNDGGLYAVLPRELTATVRERLRKYVLRSKVTIDDVSDDYAVLGVTDTSSRTLRVVALADIGETSVAREAWQAADIAAGVPQVYRENSEAFVAQMLNLDVLDGIAFDKGCYTGQEIIARAHYRGRVKRRMQRFRTSLPWSGTALARGQEGRFADGRAFRIVDAIVAADGHCEFLAVTTLPRTDQPDADVAAIEAGAAEVSAVSTSPALSALTVETLPLPYALPD